MKRNNQESHSFWPNPQDPRDLPAARALRQLNAVDQVEDRQSAVQAGAGGVLGDPVLGGDVFDHGLAMAAQQLSNLQGG